MSILVVDDAAIMRIVLKDILVRSCGFAKTDIIEAGGGIEAIAQYKKVRPDFVFCDITMPDMNGAEVVKELILIDANAKIIMCTASSDMDDIQECTSAGAKDYIVKPPRPDRVISAVEKIVGKSISEITNKQIDSAGAEKPTASSLTQKSELVSQKNEGSVTREEFNALKNEVETLKMAMEKLSK